MHSKLAIVLPIFGSACDCDVVKMTMSLRSCLHICAVTDVLRLKAGFEFISNNIGLEYERFHVVDGLASTNSKIPEVLSEEEICAKQFKRSTKRSCQIVLTSTN